ncbi:MAG: hypothetical protein AAF770_01180 [Bacteroidota bacterium]
MSKSKDIASHVLYIIVNSSDNHPPIGKAMDGNPLLSVKKIVSKSITYDHMSLGYQKTQGSLNLFSLNTLTSVMPMLA